MVRAGRGNHLRHRGQRAAQQIRRGSVSSSTTEYTKRMAGFLLVGTILGGWSASILAQEAPAATAPAVAQPAPTRAATAGTIRSIRVVGSERLEPETVRSYSNLFPGGEYTAETLDQAL